MDRCNFSSALLPSLLELPILSGDSSIALRFTDSVSCIRLLSGTVNWTLHHICPLFQALIYAKSETGTGCYTCLSYHPLK
jgi:hypothetical protein